MSKHALHIILPNIEAGMTGVWRIQRAHDLVKLDYTDGTSESAIIKVAKWNEVRSNTFSIVGTVQDIARKQGGQANEH